MMEGDTDLRRRSHTEGSGPVKVTNTGQAFAVANRLNIGNVYVGPPGARADNCTTDFEDVLTKLKIGLECRYSALKMEGLPWLENVAFSLKDYFVDLEMITIDDDRTSKPVQLQDLFKNTAKLKKPILIEGGPGYGKSTLVSKILYDWGNNQQYVMHYDLVLLLSLRYFKGSLEEALVSSLSEYEDDTRLIRTLLSNRKLRFLVVLDGFDEVQIEHVQTLYDLFQKKRFGSHLEVVVTSRPGRFTSDKNVRIDKRVGGAESSIGLKELFGKFIRIMGISKTNRLSFLKVYLKCYESATCVRVIDSVKELVDNEMLQCPLFLLMLVVIFGAPGINSVDIKTKTELYKSIHEYIIRRYKSKSDPETNVTELTMFETENEFTTLFFELGKLALEALKEDKVSFSKEDILTKCKQELPMKELGIFTESVTDAGPPVGIKTAYEPVHKSMQEFWAAYYLWLCFRKSQSSLFEHVSCIGDLRPRRGNSSGLLFPFLAGLMGHEVGFLFSALEPFAAEISECFDALTFLLMECSFDNCLFLEQLQSLFPVQWSVPYSSDYRGFSETRAHGIVLNAALSSGNTKAITWNLEHPVALPQLVKVDTLYLVVRSTRFQSSLVHLENKKVECRNLFFCMRTFHVPTSWQCVKKLIKHITFNNISFSFENGSIDWLSLICQEYREIMPYPSKIQWIICPINVLEGDLLFQLTILLKTDVLQGINLNFYESKLKNSRSPSYSNWFPMATRNNKFQEHLFELVNAAAGSNCLTNFVAYGALSETKMVNLPTLDIGKLCEGSKEWGSLIIKDRIQVSCSISSNIYKPNINYLRTRLHTWTEPAINFLQSATIAEGLPLPSFSVSDLWFENKSASRVHLCMDGFISDSHFSIHTTVLQKLTHLELILISNDLQVMPVLFKKHFLNVLPQLTSLELFETQVNLSLAIHLVEAVIKLLMAKSSCFELRNVLIHINDNFSITKIKKVQTIMSLFSRFKVPLTSGRLLNLQLVCHNSFLSFLSDVKPSGLSSLVDLFPPHENFTVKFSFWGIDSNESQYAKIVNDCFPFMYYRFEVTCKTSKAGIFNN